MWNSMRGRFILTAAALLVCFTSIVLYAQNLVRYTHDDSHEMMANYYGTHKHLQNAKDLLHRIESQSYAFAATKMAEDAVALGNTMAALDRLGRELNGDALLSNPGQRELVTARDLALRTLGAKISALLTAGPGLGTRDRLAMAGTEIAPAVTSAYRLVHLVERQVYDSVLGQTFQSLDTSEIISRLTRWAIGIVCAIMVVGYLAFELSIRRPLIRVAAAMNAEGRGDATVHLTMAGPREILTLVAAFEGMRKQIRSRQLRLESVLNNTSDGIVTFDEDLRIQGFNAAAATLFGYSEQEAVGEELAILFAGDGEQARAVMTATLAGQPAGGEQYVGARRKDNMRFDLSCKVSAFTVDDHRLFNAVVADVSERKAMFDRLTYLAQHDPLTSLYNRRHFLEELNRAVERAKRGKGAGVALFVIDLDHFKYVNDTLGHQAGDQLLVEIAGKLKQRSREGDFLARLGGDEFAVLVFDVNETVAEHIAASFNRQLTDFSFKAKGRAVDIGCSIGVAMLGRDLADGQEVLAKADLACHVAKQQGRNRHHCYQPEDEQSTARLAAEIGYGKLVRDALSNESLVLVFQPIVELPSGRPRLHEVLVRMRNADGSLLLAGAFITEAERLGLAPEIDGWVVRNTFAAMASGQVPAGTGRFSINLSGRSIGDARLTRAIDRALRDFAIDPRDIVFELTETAAIASLEQAKEFIAWLRGLGFETALDDFGAGYSSFVYLRELVTDYVKLDGSLVRNIDADPLSLAIVKAMSDVARVLGRRTIAEFVESAATAARLHEVGIDFAQGFHFGRPAPHEKPQARAIPRPPILVTSPGMA